MNPRLGTNTTFAWARPWAATIALILAFALIRGVYLAFFSPYTLIEDEAHYWEWSRRLGWSYYSKGPGVAWIIAASTQLFGLSEFAVRLPAVVSSALGSIAVAGLARAIFKDGRVGFFAVLVLNAMPAHQAVSTLMTIDGPYLACWAFGAWAAWHALTSGRALAWAAFGAAMGTGFLFKYTILVLPLGVGLFALVRSRALTNFKASGPLIALGCALLGLLPVAIWTAQNDWVTVRHLLGHVGLPGGDAPPSGGSWSYSPLWTLEFIGLQFAAGGATLVLALLAAFNVTRTHRGDGGRLPATWAPSGPAYLLCVAAPMFAMYLGVTFFTNVEANWTVAGFVTLAPLAGWAAVDAQERNDVPLRIARELSIAGVAVSITIITAGAIGARYAIPGLTRATGADELAKQTHEFGQSLVQDRPGVEPIYIAVHYGRASLMAFYLPGRPTVYASQSLMGGRRTQYDLWPQTDLTNPDTTASLVGRPAVLLGGRANLWTEAFEGVVDHGKLPAEPKADRLTFTADAFVGFPTP
ncbi:MAG: glycosyltransferase family 39 protein [Planctomycetota bacterium]